MIYLDHAAATVPFADLPVQVGEHYANPSSVHALGRASRAQLDNARRQVATACECKPSEVVFTSGATEAMHLAVIGGWLVSREQRAESSGGIVYVSPLVHSCVWSALDFLQTHFDVEVKHLPIDPRGFLDLDQIGEDVFASAQMIITEFGNSEIGLLQPVTKLGKKMIKWVIETKSEKPIYVVDAAAAVVTEKIALEYQKCDFITLSGEKFGGLKGSGVLLRREGRALTSIIGGSHELGLRGGTENVLGAVALGAALEKYSEQQVASREQYIEFQTLVREFFETKLPQCAITTPVEDYLPHVFHFQIPDSTAPVFVARADQAGLAISAGSACSSGTTTASKVLLNLGLDESAATRGVRLSWGRTTTQEELETALEIISSLLSS